MSKSTGRRQVFRGTSGSPGKCRELTLRCAWLCRWGPAKSHSDLWREHISDVGVGNLDVVGFVDVTLRGVFGTWVRRPG